MSKRLHNLIWTFENFLAENEREEMLDEFQKRAEKIKKENNTFMNGVRFRLSDTDNGSIDRKFIFFMIQECPNFLLDYYNLCQGVVIPKTFEQNMRMTSNLVQYVQLEPDDQFNFRVASDCSDSANHQFVLRYILSNPSNRPLRFFDELDKYEHPMPQNSIIMFPANMFYPYSDLPGEGPLSFIETYIAFK